MHDDPEPTEQEHEQTPERLEEEQAKTAPGHENPTQVDEPEDE
jgi:hypothetical protein